MMSFRHFDGTYVKSFSTHIYDGISFHILFSMFYLCCIPFVISLILARFVDIFLLMMTNDMGWLADF